MPPRISGSRPSRISDRLEIIEEIPFEEIREQLRRASILGEAAFCAYRRAKIEYASVETDRLWPCALYVLRTNLDNVRETRCQFLKQGVDILNLPPEKIALVRVEGDEAEPKVLKPILIEVSTDDDGAMVAVDGLHRVYAAREDGIKTVAAIVISESAAPLPSLPVAWSEVQKVDEVPLTDQKRRFRFSSPDEMFEWQIENAERFIRGFDLSQEVNPQEWVEQYAWEKYGCFQPFPNNLRWFPRKRGSAST